MKHQVKRVKRVKRVNLIIDGKAMVWFAYEIQKIPQTSLKETKKVKQMVDHVCEQIYSLSQIDSFGIKRLVIWIR